MAGRGAMHRLVRTYVKELIYGANDGIVTTLAVVSGVVGANLAAEVILILGFANLFADGFSMGASDVLSKRSAVDRKDRPALRDAIWTGAATFVGFVLAGVTPLLAYVVPWFEGWRFTAAVTLALVTLFAVGAGRALVTDRGWLLAGMEMLAIGALAAAVAYGVGAFLAGVVGGAVGAGAGVVG